MGGSVTWWSLKLIMGIQQTLKILKLYWALLKSSIFLKLFYGYWIAASTLNSCVLSTFTASKNTTHRYHTCIENTRGRWNIAIWGMCPLMWHGNLWVFRVPQWNQDSLSCWAVPNKLYSKKEKVCVYMNAMEGSSQCFRSGFILKERGPIYLWSSNSPLLSQKLQAAWGLWAQKLEILPTTNGKP